jgi:hypothetical protein
MQDSNIILLLVVLAILALTGIFAGRGRDRVGRNARPSPHHSRRNRTTLRSARSRPSLVDLEPVSSGSRSSW